MMLNRLYIAGVQAIVDSGIDIEGAPHRYGTLIGAAGAVEAIATIMAIQNNIVPPTINHFNLDSRIDNKLNFTFNTAQERVINAALSNTFGFGGHNVSLIFKKFVK